MEAKIFNAMSDPDFRIKAFSDYCDDTQQAYQRILQAESMAIEAIPDDPDEDANIDYEAKAIDILNSLDISPNNMLLFNGGYISSKDYISALIRGFDETIVHEQGSLHDKIIDLKNAAGEVITSINLDEASLQIKENLYSLTALCASNAAATMDNVADRLSVYNDKLNTIFKNAYSTVSSTATYLRSFLASPNFSPDTYLDQINSIMGITALAADQSTAVPDDMDITKYTGANPACALNFNGVFNAVGTVFNVGLKIVGGILSVGANLVGRVFKRITNFFHQTLVDPMDLEEINSKASSYTVDGWRFNVAPYNSQSGIGADWYNTDEPFAAYVSNLTDDEISDYKGKWIKYETLFGELIFSISDFSHVSNSYEFLPYVQFKPKSLNVDLVYQCAKEVWGEAEVTPSTPGRKIQSDVTVDEILEFLDKLRNQSGLYLTTDADEKKLCLSFCCSSHISGWLSKCAYIEMLNSLQTSIVYPYPKFEMCDIDDWIKVDLTRNVTNIDFIGAVTGWDAVNKVYTLYSMVPHDKDLAWTNNPFPGSNDFGKYFLYAWILNRADRKVHPVDYTFVPYRNNVDTWNESRFRIKTDAENQSAFNTLLTIAIVTVAVVALSITTTVLLKKVIRNLYMKRTAIVGQLDNAMWNGKTLTKAEKKKYIRLQRKLNGSKALSSGLQDSENLFSSISDAVSTVNEDVSGVTQILSLLR